MYQDRISIYEELEVTFEGKILVYITSDRVNMGAQIASDSIELFINHLDKIGAQKRITLYLYTRGGYTEAA